MTTYVYVPIMSAENLVVFAMDSDTGILDLRHDVHLGYGGFPLCASRDQQILYVGFRHNPGSFITSCRIDPATGGLAPVGQVAVDGVPCHLFAEPTGHYLLSAYYSEGLVLAHEICDDGSLGKKTVERQETERFAHFVVTDPTNRFAFAPHVESANRIYQYGFDSAAGRLTPNPDQPRLECSQGHGPRQMAFHPTLPIAYADNEQGSSVTAYAFDTDAGTLREQQTVSTLPPEGHPDNSNAQLHMHPNGRFIYASNRGHDSIAMFAIDSQTGLLTSLGQQPSEGMPRPFAITPCGRFLFNAGDHSKRLASFSIAADGRLTPIHQPIQLEGNAGWILPLEL